MVDEEFPKDTLPFEEEIKKYIDKYVLEEEKEKMIKATSWYFITWTILQICPIINKKNVVIKNGNT